MLSAIVYPYLCIWPKLEKITHVFLLCAHTTLVLIMILQIICKNVLVSDFGPYDQGAKYGPKSQTNRHVLACLCITLA